MLKQRNNAIYADQAALRRATPCVAHSSKLIAHSSKLIAHSSSLIAHSSKLTARRPRAGLSLIEVLASIGIVSIGLLGLASLLPVGLVTIFQAIKADRAGNCGRLAMRELVVHRMLDNQNWYDAKIGQAVNAPTYNSSKPWCFPPPIAGIPATRRRICRLRS